MYYDKDRNTQVHSPWELYDLNQALWPKARGLDRAVVQQVEGILSALEAQDRDSNVSTVLWWELAGGVASCQRASGAGASGLCRSSKAVHQACKGTGIFRIRLWRTLGSFQGGVCFFCPGSRGASVQRGLVVLCTLSQWVSHSVDPQSVGLTFCPAFGCASTPPGRSSR